MYAARRLRPGRLRRRRRRARRPAAARRGAGRCGARPGQFRRAFQRLFPGPPDRRRPATAGWDAPAPFAAGQTLGEALLTPTRIYVRSRAGAAPRRPAEGGGPHHRRRPARQSAARAARRHARRLDAGAWPLPPVFAWLARIGRRGAGRNAARVQLRHRHGRWWSPTRHAARGRSCEADGRNSLRHRPHRGRPRTPPEVRITLPDRLARMKRRVGVLISGRGSNMVSLLAAAAAGNDYPAEIVLVLSNSPEPPASLAGADRRRPPSSTTAPSAATAPRTKAAIAARTRSRPRWRSSASPATCAC